MFLTFWLLLFHQQEAFPLCPYSQEWLDMTLTADVLVCVFAFTVEFKGAERSEDSHGVYSAATHCCVLEGYNLHIWTECRPAR